MGVSGGKRTRWAENGSDSSWTVAVGSRRTVDTTHLSSLRGESSIIAWVASGEAIGASVITCKEVEGGLSEKKAALVSGNSKREIY